MTAISLTVSSIGYWHSKTGKSYLIMDNTPIIWSNGNFRPDQRTCRERQTVTEKGQQLRAPKKLSYQEQLDWKSIESQIEEAELLAESLEQQLALSGSDIGQVNDLYQQIEHAKAQIDQLMEYWTYFSEKIEAYEQFKK